MARCSRLPVLGLFTFLALASAAPPPRVPRAILLQADREARLEVSRQMAGRHPELMAAYQRLATSVQPINQAQLEVNQCQAAVNALQAPLKEAQERVKTWLSMGYREGNVVWLYPSAKYMLDQWEAKLHDLESQMQAAQGRLRVAQQRFSGAVQEYDNASQAYATQVRAFQDEFNSLYQPAYAARLKTLTARYEKEQARRSEVYIVTEFLPGKYDWTEGSGKPTQVEITADGSIKGVPPDGKDGIWQVTEDGLAVTVGGEAWLFKPGPAHSLMGTYKKKGSTIVERSALLRPKVMPNEAAYRAALQKLKDARRAQAAAAAAAPAAAPTAKAADQAKGVHVLKVEALVDGQAWLVLRGNQVHWESRSWKLPGSTDKEHPDGPYPTLLDGKPWQPVWKGSVSDPTDLPFTLPADTGKLVATVKVLKGRGSVNVLTRADAVVVDINDPRSGADRYTIELTIGEKGAGAAPSPPAAGPKVKPAPAPSPSAASQLDDPGPAATAPAPAAKGSDYAMIGVANGASMPPPSTVHVGAHEWADVANQDWLMVATRYHRLYFKPSSDRSKVSRLYQCLDNIYTFLAARSPTARKPPIDAFLIPGQYKRSRCCLAGAMRTGDRGDFNANLSSFVHEETHLFNFAFLGGVGQNNWSGEFACQYYQERTDLALAHKDPRSYVLQQLPNGPHCSFGAIGGLDMQAYGEAFAANYFLEATYGRQKHTEFREARLQLDKKAGTSAPTGPLFRQVFGKDERQLDAEWKAFYGWSPAAGPAAAARMQQPPASGQPGALALSVVTELSSPAYAGRVAGSDGEGKAARYVESAFRSLGLAPLYDGGYRHPFSVPYRDLVGPVGLVVGQRQFAYMQDFGVLQGGPRGWADGQVVFAGYGRSGGGQDDWRGLDVQGRVVMLLAPADGKPSGRPWQEAKQRGAVAVLLTDRPGRTDAAAYRRKSVNAGAAMPVLHVSSQVGEGLLAGSGWSLARLVQAADAGKAGGLLLRQRARVAAGGVEVADAHSADLVAMLKGRSSRCILVVAHYDGQGRAGDGRYFPSANDNASGVGVLLEVARSLASRRPEPPLSVVFAAVGAEEIGLCGSRELVRDPPFPLKNVALALNLDMVGGGSGSITVQTTSEDMPDYRRLVSLASRRGLTTRPYVREHLGSDAGSLQAGGVPTLFLITGGGAQHEVGDDAGNVSRQLMGNVVGLVAEFISSYSG